MVPKHDGAVDAVVLKAVRGLCSRYWLSSRVLQFHLRLLQKQNYTENMTLFKEMQDMYSDCEKEIGYAIRQQNADQEACSNNGAINGIVPKNSHLISLLYLEHGLQQHFFDHGDKGKDMFQKAMRGIGLEVPLYWSNFYVFKIRYLIGQVNCCIGETNKISANRSCATTLARKIWSTF